MNENLHEAKIPHRSGYRGKKMIASITGRLDDQEPFHLAEVQAFR